jgi:hypothetical protein
MLTHVQAIAEEVVERLQHGDAEAERFAGIDGAISCASSEATDLWRRLQTLLRQAQGAGC